MADKLKGTYTTAPERRFVERAKHSAKGVNIDEALENTVIVITTDNITALTTADINKLKTGDIVLKNDSTGKHTYVVSYKKDNTGICLTYSDATYTETISYDYVDGNWVYNSKDNTELVSKSYVDSLLSGALKRVIVQKLPTEDIDINTIYMVLDSGSSQQGNVYNEYMYINNDWELIGTTASSSVGLYEHDISITGGTVSYRFEASTTIITTSDAPFTSSTLFALVGSFKYISASGVMKDSSLSEGYGIVTKLTFNNTGGYRLWYAYNYSNENNLTETYSDVLASFTDTVRAIS